MQLIDVIKYVIRYNSKLLVVFVSFLLGVASLYLVIYLGQSIRRESDRRFHGYKLDLYSIIKKSNSPQVAPGQIRPLDIDIVEYLKHNFNYIYDVAPELRVVRTVQYGSNKIKPAVIGVLDDFRDVHGLTVSHGRFITKFDSARAYCVLGNGLYERLKTTPHDSLVGKSIRIDNQFYEIVGILGPSQSFGESRIDDELLVNYYTLAQYVINPRITKITLRANPNKPINEVTQYITRTLQNYLGDISIYEISNQQVFLATIIEKYKIISVVLGIIGIISFIVGVWVLLPLVGFILCKSKSDLQLNLNSKSVEKKLLQKVTIILLLFGMISGFGGVLLGSLFSSFIARVNGWITFLSVQASLAGVCTSLTLAIFFGLIMTKRFLVFAKESNI